MRQSFLLFLTKILLRNWHACILFALPPVLLASHFHSIIAIFSIRFGSHLHMCPVDWELFSPRTINTICDTMPPFTATAEAPAVLGVIWGLR